MKCLGSKQDSIGVWKRCNMSIAYTKTVSSSIEYHKNLSNTGLRALIYRWHISCSCNHNYPTVKFLIQSFTFIYISGNIYSEISKTVHIKLSLQWRSWHVCSTHWHPRLDPLSKFDKWWGLAAVVCRWSSCWVSLCKISQQFISFLWSLDPDFVTKILWLIYCTFFMQIHREVLKQWLQSVICNYKGKNLVSFPVVM